MIGMRSNTEQFDGLAKLVTAAADKLKQPSLWIDVAIVWSVGDVVSLVLGPHRLNVVYAADGYDLWDRRERLIRPNLTFGEAVELVAGELATRVRA